jgi:hypothetical protein
MAERHGYWTLLAETEHGCICLCACGRAQLITRVRMEGGRRCSRSCTGAPLSERAPAAPYRLYSWTVLDPSQTGPTYTCRCRCGAVKEVRKTYLLSGHSRSCRSCAARANGFQPRWGL